MDNRGVRGHLRRFHHGQAGRYRRLNTGVRAVKRDSVKAFMHLYKSFHQQSGPEKPMTNATFRFVVTSEFD